MAANLRVQKDSLSVVLGRSTMAGLTLIFTIRTWLVKIESYLHKIKCNTLE